MDENTTNNDVAADTSSDETAAPAVEAEAPAEGEAATDAPAEETAE